MVKTEKFEQIEVKSSEELREWLTAHHQQEESVWLVTYKKSVPEFYLSTDEVLDQLLSFGWIDGLRRKLSEDKTMQLIAPRKTQHWTRTYKKRADQLIKSGMMTQAGLDSIDRSKESGLWTFMDDVDRLMIPDDLRAALAKHPKAEVFFNQINASSKRFVLRWLKLAKTEKTRKARIQKLVELSAKGQKMKGS